jgi:hypothetical protein
MLDPKDYLILGHCSAPSICLILYFHTKVMVKATVQIKFFLQSQNQDPKPDPKPKPNPKPKTKTDPKTDWDFNGAFSCPVCGPPFCQIHPFWVGMGPDQAGGSN